MNCTEIDESLTEIARGKDASPALWRQALLHARSCSRCGVRLDGEQALNDLLDELRGEMRLESAPSAVESALMSEFRRQQDGVPSIPAADRRRSYVSRWLTAAAAILIVFALGMLALRFGESDRPPTPPKENELAGEKPLVGKPELGADKGGKSESAAVVAQPQPPRKNETRVRRSPAVSSPAGRKDAADPARGEVVTEFFPISGFNDLNYVESAQILRVRLPRTALISFGLPVDPNREDQRVTADVLLTSDGLARAIRFVR